LKIKYGVAVGDTLGIVADMREEGDYVEWYCSGIQGEPDDDWVDLGHVPEGTVTDQIRKDLFRLGWIVLDTGLNG
jgi:hypothetical protein